MADQILEVKHFHGGTTNNFIGGAIEKFENGINMVTRKDSKLESRPGIEIFNQTYSQVPWVTVPKRVDTITDFKDNFLYQTQNKLYYISGSGFTEIQGPSGNSAFTSTSAQFDQVNSAIWNDHLIASCDRREFPKIIYKNGSSFNLLSIGLPKINIAGITMSASGANSRLYTFVYKYTYVISGVTYTMYGPESDIITYTGGLPNTINSLPVLSNTSSTNYDTANIKLQIYRTSNTGVTSYLAGEVTNGTTTFVDSTTDGNLTAQLLLYTDADDLTYDAPPKCKYVAQLNGCCYYGNIEDSSGNIKPNSIVQSAPAQLYAANGSNSVELDDENTGLAVVGQHVLAFCKSRVYRLEGFYDSTGRGGINKVEISNTVGTISHKSIVTTIDGCFFAASDGFYATDGYNVKRINNDIIETYKLSTTTTTISKMIYGTYDYTQKRIYWSACSSDSQTETDMIYVADLSFGISDNVPFTIWNGGNWPTNFQPASLIYKDSQLIIGHGKGYVLKMADQQLNDIKIDTSTPVAQWTYLPVIYQYDSCAFDFGDVTRRKWITKIICYADSIAKAAFTIFSNNDNTGVFNELAEIRSNSPILWDDNDAVWEDPTIRWDYLPIISGIRRFPINNLRCSYKQIRITNAYTLIDSSTVSGNVNINGTTKYITLLNVSLKWDAFAVDYHISFSTDNYANSYRIKTRVSDSVLEVEDLTSNLLTVNNVGYKIYGYRKNEALRLLSYSIIYQTISTSQTPYRADAS